VIPEVLERVKQRGAKRGAPFAMPEECPACGAEVVREQAYHFCPAGLSCRPQLVGHLKHFASREAMDIEGLGEETAEELVGRETAPLWPSVRVAFAWVHKAAQILDNPEEAAGEDVRKRLACLLGAMSRHRRQAGELEEAVAHFIKVSRSYWSGLFHCYEVPDLPRTNNALEQQFGSYRWHERRITGRKTASPAMVQRGQVRILASTATRASRFLSKDLSACDLQAWKELRAQLDARREKQKQRTRFRRDPLAFLTQLEQQLLQSTLPP